MPHGVKFDKAAWEAKQAKKAQGKTNLVIDAGANPNAAAKVKDVVAAQYGE